MYYNEDELILLVYYMIIIYVLQLGINYIIH